VQIVKTIEQLPPQARKIFQLFYLQHKSYREIAAELQLSPQTVRNQKQRAAKLLKKMVGPMMAFLVSFF
jgi:RNA polymerase sigma-70 factor (ECF subfamily)